MFYFSTPSLAFSLLFQCLLHWVSQGRLDSSAGVLGIGANSAFSEGVSKDATKMAVFSTEKLSLYDINACMCFNHVARCTKNCTFNANTCSRSLFGLCLREVGFVLERCS